MRAPSATLPDVIVLESLPEGLDRKEVLNPKEDLWLTTADGYVPSAVLPLTCAAALWRRSAQSYRHCEQTCLWVAVDVRKTRIGSCRILLTLFSASL